MTDEEWARIADLVEPCSSRGKMGRPVKVDRRAFLDALFYVAATSCQWRALPENYPRWNTCHRYHLTWSREGTSERICDRLRGLVREKQGCEVDPSASVVDARSVRGASTVGAATRGCDAGKKVNGRKVFGVVDTPGLLVAFVILAASRSDNLGGAAAMEREKAKSSRLVTVFCDGGFKKAFAEAYRGIGVAVEVVNRIASGRFEVLSRRRVVERTWSWPMNNRRRQVDYERDPKASEGVVRAAHSRLLLRRLTS